VVVEGLLAEDFEEGERVEEQEETGVAGEKGGEEGEDPLLVSEEPENGSVREVQPPHTHTDKHTHTLFTHRPNAIHFQQFLNTRRSYRTPTTERI